MDTALELPRTGMRARALTVALALAVAVAFADSSIVVLALPELYFRFDTSIPGVSWVITSYNLVVAVAAFALLPLIRRLRPALVAGVGLGVFLAASIGCGIAPNLTALIALRAVQGLGAALLMAGSLPVLAGLTGSGARAIGVWATAGTLGAAFGPAAGGILTELFDWRAIFIFQAPVAALALVAVLEPHVRALPIEAEGRARGHTLRANLGLVCLFGALVGALFLAVLLIVTAWDLGPLSGAGVVSALPLAALLVRPLSRVLPRSVDVLAGSLFLAAGLCALALLPDTSAALAALGLAVCGAGFGLAVPPLTRESVSVEAGLTRSGTISIGARHVGLVLGLLMIAPLLAYELDRGAERASLNATAVILDAELPLEQKVPVVLDLRDEFEQTPEGQIPDLEQPFADNGADTDPDVAAVRDDLLGTIEATLTRSFRSSFFLAAVFAVLTLVPVLLVRRRRDE